MKLINTLTGEVLGTIMTNHSMTIEEACELLDVRLMVTEEDVLNDIGYDVANLDLVND
ncbi:hypothetical protein RWV98_03060 [Agathobaculum sp. NTUH-O15-33]|uniref:hypothetical protein n=1 Tax=Agathobaculum sp. NTUH-O15-33 TaxID=3079302 RepID=UPI0029583516|nr:hypothetical protein [Agathobaculum sp. NTUH-O15-33]WNX85272.1 hypothetical protein RWV98_03060 [Agathobaculum sp. NTUH-O15-33]